jgi:hypothetical protein
MRIGIAGTSSTGKTTLAEEVANRTGLFLLSEDYLVREAFRIAKVNGHKFSTEHMPDFTAEDVTAFEFGFLEARYEADLKHKDYVSDQTPLDTINYMLTFCSRTFSPLALNNNMEALETILHSYHGIWYLPFGLLPIHDNKKRTINSFFLFHMDCALRGLIETYEDVVQVFDVYEKDLEKRIKLVLQDMPQKPDDLPLLGVNT